MFQEHNNFILGKGNVRTQNQLEPAQIADELRKRGWQVELEELTWYKSGYFIKADRQPIEGEVK